MTIERYLIKRDKQNPFFWNPQRVYLDHPVDERGFPKTLLWFWLGFQFVIVVCLNPLEEVEWQL